MKLMVLVIFSAATANYTITPPIPVGTTTPGIRYMPATPRPSVVLEIFIDLHCPDSQEAWPVLKQVQSYYGTRRLDLVVQQMPLPYHRHAFLATQGMYAIQNSSVSANLFNYIEESLAMWSDFGTTNTANLTETEVTDMIADMAVRVTGVDKTHFIADIPLYRNATRAAWKYAAKRGVAVTPVFFLNGVELGIGISEPTYEEWIAFLDPIVPAAQ